jgi:Matrixin/Carboxypeptidase regulatory-like domain
MSKFAVGIVPIVIIAAVLLIAAPGFSYLPEYASKTAVAHWNSPPQWRINTATNGNVTVTGTDITSVTAASFATWESAPNVSGVVSGITQGSPTSIAAHSDTDGVNLVCFVCTGDFGSGGDTLAITYTSFNDASGQMMDADMLFNPAANFIGGSASCPSNPAAGSPACVDLQTVATHEIGHFIGLDHSAVTSAMMYPFAPDVEHDLSSDDVAGISKIYPASSPTIQTGNISGTITNSSGAGLCGISVFAGSNTAGTSYPSPVRKTPIGTMTNADGTYTITGLPPDSYTVTAEPLDGPVDHTNVDTYASTICGASTLPTNVTTRQH